MSMQLTLWKVDSPRRPKKKKQKPTVVGSVTRRGLRDGRPYPPTLAAHQLNIKHCSLLDDRLEELAAGPVIVLDGMTLTDRQRFDLYLLVQRTILPELYDDNFDTPLKGRF